MTWLLAIAAFTFLALTSDPFLSAANLRNILLQTTVMSLLVLGGSMVMMAGGLDITVENNITFTTAVAAWLMVDHYAASGWQLPAWAGIAASLTMGALVGVFQAVCILKVRMNPWMTSLSIGMIVQGIGTVMLAGSTLFPMPQAYRTLGIGKIGPVHLSIIVVLLIYLGTHALLTQRPLGREWYATGANRRAARASAIDTTKVVVLALIFGGVASAFAGWMWMGRTNAVAVGSSAGLTFEVIAAAVMGGISLKGGRGDVLRAWSGILLLTLISNGLNLNDVPSVYVPAARGLLFFLATVIDGFRTRSGF
jgi:ribose/xylose/arabinose/galactoside ABC-type transport system permease subunit